MATSNDKLGSIYGWYLDICYLNYMTSHREWLDNFDDSRNTKIRFTDNKTIPSERVGDVLIKGKEGN